MFSAVTKKVLSNFGRRTLYTEVPVGLVGAPMCKGTGQEKSGLLNAPEALRQRGLIQSLQEHGINVQDYGDIHFEDPVENQPLGRCKYPLAVSNTCQKLSGYVKRILEKGHRCLTIGGDHSLGMASVYGHSQVEDQVCVLWIDAHVDINTEYTTPSGNMHGMPCSFFLKEMQKYKKQSSLFEWLQPCINARNIAFIGCHSIDPCEKFFLTQENITHFTMAEIDRLGIVEVVNRSLDAINPTGKMSLHVSFDIDCMDKTLIESTTCPTYGGLNLREVFTLIEEIYKRGMPRAVDVVEIDTTKGTEVQIARTLQIAMVATKALMGISRSGIIPRYEIPMQ